MLIELGFRDYLQKIMNYLRLQSMEDCERMLKFNGREIVSQNRA